ncbi:MAG: tRNA epoxyqueuosine(34) reductase QueG [Actinomycetia bacterium]|nr:tRNA epoxyqueuosine(34) reductase QueG [Actinomycetes bacterium]MCP4959691.1 tRNA epoxyqueuosine(34) reductase QueG [Actinomycetes bacterium]
MNPPTTSELAELAASIGLDAIGLTDASEFSTARRVIEERKHRGLDGGMWFTYGRPDRSTDPSRILPEARSIIVAAMAYDRTTPEPPDATTVAAVGRFVWEPYYDQLAEKLEMIADRLRSGGARAVVVFDDNRLVDRAAAYRAGLGWFGKNTMLLIDGAGSWFVLGSVVTDAELEPEDDQVEDGCGTCVRCQIACPTGALQTAGELDGRRCLAWLLQSDGVFPAEHREALGNHIYGCDDCQVVCPPNVRFTRSRPNPEGGPAEAAWVDAISILAASDDELMDRYGRWYIPRRRPEYLRRNALVVLGNVGEPGDERVVAAVVLALSSEHPVVVAHAVWCARRFGRDDLVDNLDPTMANEVVVAGELERAVPLRR